MEGINGFNHLWFNMAQEGRDTAEFKAFISCTTKIVSTVKGNLSIADKLLEERLISDETYDEIQSNSITERTKARKIFSCVKEKIKLNTDNFNVFCDILEESSYYLDLLSKLKGKLYRVYLKFILKKAHRYYRSEFC